MQTEISEDQFKDSAAIINCEVACIKAVYEVEAAHHGRLEDGRPKILFEGHRFWKQLVKAGFDPVTFLKSRPEYKSILYKDWTKKFYLGGAAEWKRMTSASEACVIIGAPVELALRSASYGAFQIMGENFAACGYESAQDMIYHYNRKGEAEMLRSFIQFVKATHLDDELVAKNWTAFARGYNGTQEALNNYHGKLYIAYLKYKN